MVPEESLLLHPGSLRFWFVANAPKGRTMPSPFWVANPFSPCDLGPQLKSSPVNNLAKGGVGLSIPVLPEKRASGILRQGQRKILFYLKRCCFKLDAFTPIVHICIHLYTSVYIRKYPHASVYVWIHL